MFYSWNILKQSWALGILFLKEFERILGDLVFYFGKKIEGILVAPCVRFLKHFKDCRGPDFLKNLK